MTVDWTALIVAVFALVGTLYTANQTRQKARKPNIIEQAGQVATIATDQLQAVFNELQDMRKELDKLEDENSRLRRRIYALELEIARLGGDPAVVAG